MISCLHDMYDDRIYWKEAVSLKKQGLEVIHLCVGSDFQDFLSSEGIRIIRLGRRRYFKNPYFDKLFRTITFKKNIVTELLEKTIEVKAGVYHFHDLQINKIGKKIKNLPHKPAVIYDVHEPYPEIARYLTKSKGIAKLFHILYSVYIDRWQISCSKYYDAVIATEENVADYFRRHIDNNKVKVVYNYCDFETTASKNVSDKIYDLIYVGGISKWRGVFEFIQTAVLIRNAGLKLKILFIGPVKEHGLKQKLTDIIKKEKLEEIFILKEPVVRSELIHILKSGKIGICIFADNPVYRIIMPIKIFEYLSVGLPVICNNFGHPMQIITKENAGMAIDEVSPENILDSALIILRNEDLYHELSRNAVNSMKKYNWKNMEKVLFDIYGELLNKRNID